MGETITVSSAKQVRVLRATLQQTAMQTRKALAAVLRDPDWLRRVKFERLGSDPLDPDDKQNVAEQIDMHATYAVALDAVAILMREHKKKTWHLAPGAHGSGHDIVSEDNEVAAEVFAAVHAGNNQKLSRDMRKIGRFRGPHKYAFYRTADRTPGRETRDGVHIIQL